MKGARLTAALALLEVEGGGYSNLVLKNRLGGLEGRDKSFAAALVLGTLEHRLTLDYALSSFVPRSLEKLDREVLCCLRLGLYQALYMDGIPVSAAVSESVKLCRSLKKSSAAGMVNAVLRRASAFEAEEIDNIKDRRERLSVKYSLCDELAEMLSQQYGESAEEIMEAFFSKPRSTVRVNALRTTPEALIDELAESGIEAVSCALEGALEIRSGDWLASAPLLRGDMRAQTAVWALAPQRGERVLDMCAAPGGKTLTAAQLMGNEGEIVALDRSERRLSLLREQAALEGVSIIKALCRDAGEYEDEAGFDRVLCDAPCSGYGEIAAKPELRYKSPELNAGLYAIQKKLLERGARLLKKGGRLVYSTCTLDSRENEEAIAELLKPGSGFKSDTASGEGGFRKILPQKGDPEGFFIASFSKIW
ncbi:MAG: 16S rRNA (cytosine(967)-C(5))-methyltransferase RsmB [Oscillospiraceae bacterium]|nr:16S rRNA (cytosine(967)-C(5))-methyltransferase RsmB [Oscillospiraceae bacterium]